MSDLNLFFLTALGLLAIGLYGMLARRTLVGMLIGVELALSGAGLSIVAASQLASKSPDMGQAATLLVMGLAAAEAALLLAIIIVTAKRFGQARAQTVSELKG